MKESMHASEISIRVLLIEESDSRWSAQCLEYDIAAQANSISEIKAEFERVFIASVMVSIELGREPLAGFPPAPDKYWKMFEAGTVALANGGKGTFKLPDETPSAAVIASMKLAPGSTIKV